MKLYREGDSWRFLGPRVAPGTKLFCKGQYRLAVYPCTQCKSQLWQGAKEESYVEIYQKLVISSRRGNSSKFTMFCIAKFWSLLLLNSHPQYCKGFILMSVAEAPVYLRRTCGTPIERRDIGQVEDKHSHCVTNHLPSGSASTLL